MYVIFIASPLQQYLREGASVLRYTYIASKVLLLWGLLLYHRAHLIVGHVKIFFTFISINLNLVLPHSHT